VSEIQRLAGQIRRGYHGPAWHGPAIVELLRDVTAEEAAARPIAGSHSIWELTTHLKSWSEFVLGRLRGASGEVEEAQNFPQPAAASPDAWSQTLEELDGVKRELLSDVEHLAIERLDEPVAGRDYELDVLLRGVVEHDAYHGGQIAILKNALRGR